MIKRIHNTQLEVTLKVLMDKYESYLNNWQDQSSEEIMRGVQILNQAEALGYRLSYRGRKFSEEDGTEIEGYVYAQPLD